MDTLRVAIVGLGPKGLFALERLLDRAASLSPSCRIEIEIFERHPVPGAGPVYDPAQPPYLLMNFPGSRVDAWDAQSRIVQPARRLSFSRWQEAAFPDAPAPEYPPRADVGLYLSEVLETLLACVPAQAAVVLHRAEVTDLERSDEGWAAHSPDGRFGPFDEVLIATGHRFAQGTGLEEPLVSPVPVIPSVFPVSGLTVERIPAGATVGIRGLALTFIDAALALTEGRGGTFRQEDEGWLRYVPGPGAVARLVPFSRRGRPPLAKPPAPGWLTGPEGRALAAPSDLVSVLTETAGAVLPGAEEAIEAALQGALDGHPPATALSPRDEMSVSLEVAAGFREPELQAALGIAWRTVYPELVRQGRGPGIDEASWPAFARLAREMERLAFGPPAINVAKVLALVDAGVVDFGTTTAAPDEVPVDVMVDAVLPGPGVDPWADSLDARLVASGAATFAPGRRGLLVERGGACVNREGAPTPGLSAIGRPTEDWVIGNDTLDRTLHPEADDWARRVAGRLGRRGRFLRAGCIGVTPLSARLEPWAMELMGDPAQVAGLIDTHGSPVNIIDPGPLARNAGELQAVAESHGVPMRIFFARKANKALSMVEEALANGLGIDVASERELAQTLMSGAGGGDVVVTAAVKPRSLLELCAESGATVMVDNADEVRLAREVARHCGRTLPIAFRLSPVVAGSRGEGTRFGLRREQAQEIAASLGSDADLEIRGVHFHLDGYDPDERVAAITEALSLLDAIRESGHAPGFLDIGGGIPMSYLEDEGEWQGFWDAHERALRGEGEALTYGGEGLGLLEHAGEILGSRAVYPYYQRIVRGAWLDRVLGAEVSVESGRRETVADAIRSRGVELRCEPGRSLADGCGLTAARVEFRKERTDGTYLIGLAMNRTQCRSTSADFLVDPLLLPRAGDDGPGERTGGIEGYLVGAYCIERELLTWRRLRFPSGVAVGDIVVFPNTAGYLMHILESASHQIPLARNLVTRNGSPAELDPIDQETSGLSPDQVIRSSNRGRPSSGIGSHGAA